MTDLSIITPCYNAADDLPGFLAHFHDIDLIDFELIVVDGASSDNSVNILQRFAEETDYTRYISEPDKGLYDAMNKGIDMAKGQWIYFMGTDDRFQPDKKLYRYLKNERNTDILYGNVMKKGEKYDGGFTLQRLTEKNISHQAMFFKKSVFDTVGKYTLDYKICADYEHNIRLFSDNSIKKKYVDLIVGKFGEGGISSTVIEEKFFLDLPGIFKKYSNTPLDLSPVYRFISKIGLQKVYDGKYLKGLKIINRARRYLKDNTDLKFAFAHMLGRNKG